MTSKAAGLIVAVALFAPALAAAKPGHGPAVKAAVKACVQERKQGREAFVNKYGHPAQRNCVRETLPEARNAAEACRAERNEDGVEAFRDNWGENENGANAGRGERDRRGARGARGARGRVRLVRPAAGRQVGEHVFEQLAPVV